MNMSGRPITLYCGLRRCSWIWISQLFLLCHGFHVYAEEQEQLFESSRVWGRGGTFVAAFDSDEASRFNPATIIESKMTFQLRPFQLDGFVGEETTKTLKDLGSVSSDQIGFLRKLDQKFGKKQYLGAQLSLFAIRFGSFELAPFVGNKSWLELENPPVPELSWQSDTLAGLQLSYSLALLDGRLLLGMNVRPAYRLYVKGDILVTDIMEFIPPAQTKFEDFSPLRSGILLGSDLGVIFKVLPNFRLGLLVQNAAGMGPIKKADKNPPVIQPKVHLGSLYRYSIGRWDFDALADIQDLENRKGLPLARLIHLGTEVGTNYFSRDHDVGLTLGINEGYLTKGLFVDLFFVRLDVSSYAVEEGISPGQQASRRLAFTLRSSITF